MMNGSGDDSVKRNTGEGHVQRSSSTRVTRSSSSDEGWLCELCKTNYTKKSDKLMECDYCNQHFCIQCLDMPPKLYNQMVGRLDIKWFCPLCSEKVEKNLKADREIEEKCKLFMQSFEARINSLEQKAEKFEQKAEKFVTVEQVQDIIAKESKTNKEIITVNDGAIGGDIEESVIKEMAEREKRKNNAILFRVPEPKTNIKIDKVNADIQLVKDVGAAVNVIIDNDDIVKVARLGKKKTTPDTESTVQTEQNRPLLVTFGNETVKKSLFTNASRLQYATGNLEGISLDHDMTPKEREETKKLKLEAKKKEEESVGKFLYRVRGPPWSRYIKRIVKPN